MSNPIPPVDFEIFATSDGSPTLSLQGGEKMHSLEGAFSETWYIYSPCVKIAMTAPSPAILSMGLGIAYNEIMIASWLLKSKKETFHIASFESIPFLKDSFTQWLTDKPSSLQSIYDEVLDRTSTTSQVPSYLIKEFLSEAFSHGQLTIGDSLPKSNPFPFKFHGILYDAFSSQTDESLWSEEHFNHFLNNFSNPIFCSFATYAATGKLKRALRKKNFKIEKKAGFGMKRESTLASRP